MSIAVPLDELLDYSDHEREKWERWLMADGTRTHLRLQGAGRLPTVADLLDHVFLVERRHLARLDGGTPPDSTGVPSDNIPALFEYARLVRADFRCYVADANERVAAEAIDITLRNGESFRMPKRQLAVHIVLHEVRHFAQLALAARLAGIEPPGDHDLFYFRPVNAGPA